MQAKFYNFKKRILSTKRPTAAGTAFEVVLKAPTDIHNPTLTIKASTFNFNYCYIATFGTYYWVRGVTSLASNLWEVQLQNDAYASYKEDILASSGYVTYAANDYDPKIFDERCAMYELNYDLTNLSLFSFSRFGSFILRIIAGGTNDGYKFTTSFVLNYSQVKALAAYFNDGSITWSDLVKSLSNAFDCIVDLKWIPVNINDPDLPKPGHVARDIYLGNLNTDINAWQLSEDTTVNGTTSIEIPWAYNDFRRYSPYSQLKLYVPYYGIVDVPTAPFVNKTYISCYYSFDWESGDVTIVLGNDVDNVFVPIFTFNYNVSIPLPVSKLNSNLYGIITSALELGSSAVAFGYGLKSGNVGAAIQGGIGLASSIFNSWAEGQRTNVSYKSNQPGFSWGDMPQNFYLICEYHETEDPDNYAIVKGRPIMEYTTLQRFVGGFVQVSNCDIEIDGLPGELDAINAALESGLYLE